MKSITFTEKIIIKSTQTTVFDYTQDYSKRLNWDTFLKHAELLGADAAAKGVKAYCVAKNGLGMETEYLTYQRPRATAIKMTKGPYMFKSFIGSWKFKDLGENNIEVAFMYSFNLRFPFNLIPQLIKKNLQSNVKQRLLDLKMTIEN